MKPKQRDRVRLDRYDAQDFEEVVAAMKAEQKKQEVSARSDIAHSGTRN